MLMHSLMMLLKRWILMLIGVGNNADAFPNDANETMDTDGDGVGDNAQAAAEGKA